MKTKPQPKIDAENIVRTVFDAHQRLCNSLDSIERVPGDQRDFSVRVLLAYIEHARAVGFTSPIPGQAEKALIDLGQALADLDNGSVADILKPTTPVLNATNPRVRERKWLTHACIDYIKARDNCPRASAIERLLQLMGHGVDDAERKRISSDLQRKPSSNPTAKIASDSALANAAKALKEFHTDLW